MESIPVQVTVSSKLEVTPDELWEEVASAQGVNYEMSPWLRFEPPEGRDLFQAAASGEVLRLKVKGPFGLPLGHYPLQLVRIDQGSGFLEQTWMLPFLLWQHERRIEPDVDCSLITDELGWRWRVRLLDPLFRVGTRAFFNHRHRKLRRRFESAMSGKDRCRTEDKW